MDLVSLALTVLVCQSAFITIPFCLCSINFPCPLRHECDCERINVSYFKVGCHNRNLKIFPNFTIDAVYIDLSFNLIEEIRNDVNIPENVEYLDISTNRLTFIQRGAMAHLSSLRYLDLSYNRGLTFDVLPNITFDLQFTSIRVLKLNRIHCENGRGTKLRYDHFKFLSNTSLEEMEIASNRIEEVEPGIVRNCFKSLRKIDVSDNRVITSYYLLEIQFVENLKFVNFSFSSSAYGPNTALTHFCVDKTRGSNSKYINHKLLSIDANTKNIQITVYFPPSLEVLDASNSFVHYDPGVQNITYEIPNLKAFYSQSNLMSKMYGISILRNKTEYVDLSNNYCSYISPTYFERATSLKTLNLSNNYLGIFFINKSSSAIFQNLRSLEYLDLSRNGISEIPNGLLSPLIRLNHLILALNMINILDLPMDNLQSLRILDLSTNQIRFLGHRNMKQLDDLCKLHHVDINLTGNILSCSCETRDFLKWMQRHRSNNCITFTNFKSYRCAFTNLTELSLTDIDRIVEDLSLHCSSDIGLIASSIFVVILFVMILTSAIFYRYRWRLRYLYYTTKRAFQVVKPGCRAIYKYDVFLSYADEDSNFVHEEVLNTLEENDEDITICCHKRDFIPGRPIADNIAAAVHESRFTMCVISKNYLESYWCMYEYNLAKMETEYARGGENVIILVLVNDFPSAKLPITLLNHIQRESYLEVPQSFDAESRLQFAERLKGTIS